MAGTTKGDFDGTSFIALGANGATHAWNTFAGTTTVVSQAPSTPMTSVVEFHVGHPNEGWGLGSNAGGTRIQRYFRNVSGNGLLWEPLGPGRSLSQVTTPAGLAVVVAPEPGTMIALGAGVLALVRRRRSA